MVIRINTDELNEFKTVLTNIKSNVEELGYAMNRVLNNITYGGLIPDPSIISDIEKLGTDIALLKHEIEFYIHDINIISEEFKNADLKTKESTTELRNLIECLLTKNKSSFIPATYSINSSIASEENEIVMSACGIEDKVNETVDLNRYASL